MAYNNEPRRHWAVTYHATPSMIGELTDGSPDDEELKRRGKELWNRLIIKWTDAANDALIGIAGQLERCPTTSNYHFQLHFRTAAIRRTQLYGYLKHDEASGGASAEPARNISALHAYVRKEDSRIAGPFEWPTSERAKGGQGQRNDITDLLDAIREGADDESLLADMPITTMRYFRNLQALRQSLRVYKPRDVSNPPHCYLYWGESGAGKTRAAYGHGTRDNIYIKGPGKWWDGYTQQQVVILDDFNGKFFGLTQKEDMCMLLRLLDRYPLRVELKGATIDFNSPTIIITSNQRFEDWYQETFEKEPEFLEAVRRRFLTVQHFRKGPFNSL